MPARPAGVASTAVAPSPQQQTAPAAASAAAKCAAAATAAARQPHATQHRAQQQQHQQGLQGHHIEVAIICLSGLRLCTALACSSGGRSDAALLLLLHACALLLEFCGAPIVSTYQLRRSASHGIAQGVLAVPSVLAALAAAAPGGGWHPWLQGSCCAGLSVLAAMQLQSLRQQHGSRPAGRAAAAAATTAARPARGVQEHPLLLLGSVTAAAAVAAAAAGQEHAPWHAGSAAALPWLQQLAAAAGGTAVSAVVWAGLTAASFCCSLQMLPRCFSLGEAALLAQGAACLTVAAGAAARRAALFVPAAVCQQLPPGALAAAVALGGCTPGAHTLALSLQMLPAVIVLILAATVCACLLLRLLWLSTHSLKAMLVAHRPHSSKKGRAVGQKQVVAQQQQQQQRSKAAGRSTGGGSSTLSLPLPPWLPAALRAAAASLVLAAALCGLVLWLACAAAWTLLEFLPAVPGRLPVLAYWVGVLAATLPLLRLWLAQCGIPQIIVRKVYHLLALGLFVPVFFWDLALLSLSLGIAFAALVAAEVLRCTRLPLLGRAVQQYMQKFVDERDSGPIYITHFTLLLGLAVPVWLSLRLPAAGPLLASQAAAHSHQQQQQQWAMPAQQQQLLQLVLSGLSGIVIIGVGDTAASLVGSTLGRRPVHAGARKTLEGTGAGIAACLAAWAGLLAAVKALLTVGGGGVAGLLAGHPGCVARLVAATAGAGLLEAATSQLDNILLPLWYLPHVVLL